VNNLLDAADYDNYTLAEQDSYKLVDSSFDINLNTRLKNKKIF
jgi:hypothetical protein